MSEAIISCPICGNPKVKQILINRPDYEFGICFKSNYWRCLNNECKLVFVNPLPTNTEISTFYKAYTTHNSNITLKSFSVIAKINRFLYLKKISSLFKNADSNHIKVLDYGCGNGNLLHDLSIVGIKHVIGYDMDPIACSVAVSQNLVAFSDLGKIELQGPYDYIFLNHVIEHLPNPYNDIRDLISLLNNNGKIIVRTPNSYSVLSKFFGENWRGWETPRHLHIFNIKSMEKLVEKLEDTKIVSLNTSNLMFTGIFNESFHSNLFRNTLFGKIIRKFLFVIFYPLALLFNLSFKNHGEEVSLVLMKKQKDNP